MLAELGKRLARLRLEKNLTQAQLAREAGVSRPTLQRLEAGAVATQLSGFLRICRTLGLLERFNHLIPGAVASPMAQLKQAGRKRKRATGGKTPPPPAKKWTWGDES